MSILEILSRHIADVCNHGDIECRCGEQCDTPEGHRKHLAQVLEQHEREAKAEALEEAADEIERLENIGDTAQGELNEEQTAEYWLYHGTPKTTWLRDRAAELKETP